ncbi:hypothetical protein N7541_004868 [Penicillium brevicompactum]|uniref:WW domain-containing protein n=1 Tax=Penicillium brevicompactum TaxID=5074 RepID=A0A9W9RCH2_PENBR|nr:hypothetical protein N7541_004868 [Penicillium brevicompactum]
MAPEAPADTAGPSSPPPQLPEGWLPQWEGVRRQWYYVQRTTGKSQWEIPTEPIHLTPSTTPSIGGGPSQAPQQANNITPGAGSENHMEGEPLARCGQCENFRRESRSLCLRSVTGMALMIYPQSERSSHEADVPGWYSNHPGQHLPGGYDHHAASAGYGQSPHRGDGVPANGVQSTLYTNQPHPGYPHDMAQNATQPAWGHNGGGYQAQPDPYNMSIHPELFQGYPASATAMHGHQPPASWAMTNSQQEQMNRQLGGARIPQQQWPSEFQPGHTGASGGKHPMSTLQQPFYGSYQSPQRTEQHSSEYGSRALAPSVHQEAQQYQSSPEKFSNHSPQSMVDQARFQGYPGSRSQSQHNQKDPALQGFSPLQQAQTKYQQQHMIRTHSGSEVPHPWPGGPVSHGNNQHHNMLAQASPNHYAPQHQMGHDGTAGYPDSTHAHQMPYLQSTHYPMQSVEGTGRSSGSQFVSGPWAATPPSSGPM